SAVGSRYIGYCALYQIETSQCIRWRDFFKTSWDQNLSGANDSTGEESANQIEKGMGHQKLSWKGCTAIETCQVRRCSNRRRVGRDFLSCDCPVPAWAMDPGDSENGSNTSDSRASFRIWITDSWRRSLRKRYQFPRRQRNRAPFDASCRTIRIPSPDYEK